MLEQTYAAPPAEVWRLWTTAEGIEQWWSPDGFETKVHKLELVPGGELVHEMTAVAPEMVSFMESNGMPLSTTATKTFKEIEEPTRLAYTSEVDFVPDHAPYEHATVVELAPEGEGTRVTMTLDPMHDEEWTGRVVAGRTNELNNLAAVLAQD